MATRDQRALASPGLLLLFRAMPTPGAQGNAVLGTEPQVGPCEQRSAGQRWLSPSWRGLPAPARPGRTAFPPTWQFAQPNKSASDEVSAVWVPQGL